VAELEADNQYDAGNCRGQDAQEHDPAERGFALCKFGLWVQPVEAKLALKRSAGVSKSKVLLDLSSPLMACDAMRAD